MIAFRFIDAEKRRCLVRGVNTYHNLFRGDRLNTERPSDFPTDSPIEMDFDELPDIIRARITMLTLAENDEHIEGVGLNGVKSPAVRNFMYVYEEE